MSFFLFFTTSHIFPSDSASSSCAALLIKVSSSKFDWSTLPAVRVPCIQRFCGLPSPKILGPIEFAGNSWLKMRSLAEYHTIVAPWTSCSAVDWGSRSRYGWCYVWLCLSDSQWHITSTPLHLLLHPLGANHIFALSFEVKNSCLILCTKVAWNELQFQRATLQYDHCMPHG